MKTYGGEKARQWRHCVAKSAERNDDYVRTFKFPLEPLKGLALDFNEFEKLYNVTQGLGKGTLTGLLCATHLSGFQLFSSANEARAFQNRKHFPSKDFQSAWKKHFDRPLDNSFPHSLYSYLSKGSRKQQGKEPVFTPEKIQEDLYYKIATGKGLGEEPNKISEFLLCFGKGICNRFKDANDMKDKVGEALKIFDESSVSCKLSLPPLQKIPAKLEPLKPKNSSIAFDIDLPVPETPLDEIDDDIAMHLIVAQKLKRLKPAKVKEEITKKNALSWLFGKGYKYWKETSVDDLCRDYKVPDGHKHKIKALKEWFEKIPEETLFGYKGYADFRSELGGKIDSWTTNYLSRLEELKEIFKNIDTDFQLQDKLKEAVCSELFDGLGFTAEQLETSTNNIAGEASKVSELFAKLRGETEAFPTPEDIARIDDFRKKINGLFGLFEKLKDRIKQAKKQKYGKLAELDGFKDLKLKRPAWLEKKLPKVNKISGGIPRFKEELKEIEEKFSSYTGLYEAHIKEILDWVETSGKCVDPLITLAERELTLLKKRSNDKKEHAKDNLQARRRLLHGLARIAVSGTKETRTSIKSQLKSCGFKEKDLNKLIDNDKGALYKSPFAKGRHEVYEIKDESILALDILGLIQQQVAELERQKDERQDLRHHRDWLSIKHSYNITRLNALPEEVPVCLAKKEVIEKNLTLPDEIIPLLTRPTISRSLLIRIINLYRSEISGVLAQLFRESFIIKTKFQRVGVNELCYVPKKKQWTPPEQYLTSKKPLGKQLGTVIAGKKSGQSDEIVEKLIEDNIKKKSWPKDGLDAVLMQAPHDWYFDLKINSYKSEERVEGYPVGKKGLNPKVRDLTTPFRLVGPSSFKNKLDKRFQDTSIKIGEHNLIVFQAYEQTRRYENGKLVAEAKPGRTSAELAVTLTDKKMEVDKSLRPVQETVIGIDLGEAGIGYAVFDAKEISTRDADEIKPIYSGAIRIPAVRNLIKRVNHYRNKIQPNQKFQQRYNNSLQLLRENAIGDVVHKIDALCMKYKGMPVLESGLGNLAKGSNQLKLIYDRILNLYIDSKVDAHKRERKHHWCGSERWEHTLIHKKQDGAIKPLLHFPGVKIDPKDTSRICSVCKRNPYQLIDDIPDYKDSLKLPVESGGKVKINGETILLKSKTGCKKEARAYLRRKERIPFEHPLETKNNEITCSDLKKHLDNKQLRQPQQSSRSKDTTQSQYHCVFEDCGKQMHADENAAINIVRKWASENVYIEEQR